MNDRQKRFAEEYAANPNATAAASAAGYSPKSARAIGAENLTKPYIAAYIRELQQKAEEARIADITEVKQFLTSVMRSEEENTKSRLRAAELLAKSAGELIQKVDVSAQVEAEVEDVVFYIPDNGREIRKIEEDKNG